ncbi:MAG: lipocalin family protein [Rikenellaceae bacterium]
MKTIKFTIFAAAALTTLAACNSNVETIESGLIAEQGDSTITIVNAIGDTLTFNTATAETLGDGMLAGDSVSVTFLGKVAPAGEPATAATKVVTKHIARASEMLLGSWVETVTVGKESKVQGISLTEGGVASSIDMADLAYKNWTSAGSSIYADADTIILNGDVTVKDQTTAFSDTLAVTLNGDSLILSNATKTLRLAKQQ